MRMQLSENTQDRSATLARLRRAVPVLCALALLTGCQREEARMYTVKKDPPRTDEHDHSHEDEQAATPAPPPKPRPQVSWTLPKGWTESGAGQMKMNVATFSIQGEGGEAQVTITPLTKLGGKDAEIVNMWREQVGLEKLPREVAAKQFEPVSIGPDRGNLFQIEGKGRPGEGPYAIVTAMVHREEASWFYKLAGNAELVAAQKPVFIEFLKSIKLTEAPAAASSTEPAPVASTGASGSGGKFNWSVPSAWTPIAPGPMQAARFTVPEVGGAKAEVFVSVFPNDTGGLLANVNRWRRQIGLEDVTEAGLGTCVTPLEGAGAGAVFVELNGPQQTLLGAVVPREGGHWFYRLTGGSAAVLPQKDAFRGFAKSKP
jgi:hypothetical protein